MGAVCRTSGPGSDDWYVRIASSSRFSGKARQFSRSTTLRAASSVQVPCSAAFIRADDLMGVAHQEGREVHQRPPVRISGRDLPGPQDRRRERLAHRLPLGGVVRQGAEPEIRLLHQHPASHPPQGHQPRIADLAAVEPHGIGTQPREQPLRVQEARHLAPLARRRGDLQPDLSPLPVHVEIQQPLLPVEPRRGLGHGGQRTGRSGGGLRRPPPEAPEEPRPEGKSRVGWRGDLRKSEYSRVVSSGFLSFVRLARSPGSLPRPGFG